MGSASKRKTVWIVVAVLVAIGASVGIWLRMKKVDAVQYVQFTNGFDVPVSVEVTDGAGTTSTIEVPARGRVEADLEGKCTLKLTGPKGPIKTLNYTFPARDERKKRCVEFVNILGSAAIVEEEIVYGVGLKGSVKTTAGVEHVKMCPRWGFETTAPPKAITVEKGEVGMELKWMHYRGEGDWVTSIESLLAVKPNSADQARIRAFNLAVAVSRIDPENPRFAALGPKFMAACDALVELFKTGPLAGKGRKDCVTNTKALFKLP